MLRAVPEQEERGLQFSGMLHAACCMLHAACCMLQQQQWNKQWGKEKNKLILIKFKRKNKKA
jgi:hypothetical protein